MGVFFVREINEKLRVIGGSCEERITVKLNPYALLASDDTFFYKIPLASTKFSTPRKFLALFYAIVNPLKEYLLFF